MKLQLEKTPCFIVSKPESEKERRCIRYMKTFGIDAVPMYGFRAENCGISTDYYHTREKEKAKVKTIVAGLRDELFFTPANALVFATIREAWIEAFNLVNEQIPLHEWGAQNPEKFYPLATKQAAHAVLCEVGLVIHDQIPADCRFPPLQVRQQAMLHELRALHLDV